MNRRTIDLTGGLPGMRLVLFLCTIISFCTLPAFGEDLSVSTANLAFRLPQGGPLPKGIKVSVASSGPWKARVSNQNLLAVSPAEASASTFLTVTPVGWHLAGLAAGTYSGTVTVIGGNVSRTIEVSIIVIARQLPKVSFLAAPKSCADAPGLAPANAALCTVPDERPPGNFAPPPTGGSYLDPTFGALVRIVGSSPSLHGYSTPSPVSAENRYALISQNGTSTVVELPSGRPVRTVPMGIEGTLWDARDPSLLYSFSGTTVRRYDLRTAHADVLADYARPPHRFESISSGGTGEISKDNWISFYAPKEGQVCALELGTVKTYCGAIPAGFKVDYPTMSKGVDSGSGLRYVLLVSGGGPFALYAVNPSAGRLDLITRGPEDLALGSGNLDGICDPGEPCLTGGHSDILEDSAGNQVLVMALEEQAPCGYSIYTLQLNKGKGMGLPVELGGGLKRAFPLFRCGGQDLWVDYHVGCAKAAPYCAFSTTSEGFNKPRDPNDLSPQRRSPYIGEIMIMRDNGAEFRRLAKHRSFRFSNEDTKGYWSTPRAAISPDGAYILADSNFGFPGQHRVIVIETGYGKKP